MPSTASASSFVIRRAVPSDALALATFAARAFADTFAADNTPEDMATYLADAFGDLIEPVFTPPWNRCTAVTAEVLADAGFAVLSRDSTATPLPDARVAEVPVTVDWFGSLDRPWGPTLLEDQYRGGALAWALGDYPVAILAAAMAVAWIRDDARETRRYDRKADRDGEAELAAYNQMLAARASLHEQTLAGSPGRPGRADRGTESSGR